MLVAERDGEIVAWAGIGPYDDASDWYSGIGEAAVYVARDARRIGAGLALLEALERAAEDAGRYKLIAKIFDTNEPSLRLFERAGYRTGRRPPAPWPPGRRVEGRRRAREADRARASVTRPAWLTQRGKSEGRSATSA